VYNITITGMHRPSTPAERASSHLVFQLEEAHAVPRTP
jgi:hypothetical protein